MSPRTGRPIVGNPKTIKLQIRIDEETLNKIDEYADELKSNRSDVVRKGINLVGESLKRKE